MTQIEFKIIKYQTRLNKATVTMGNKNYVQIGSISCTGPGLPADVVRFVNISFLEIGANETVPANTTTKLDTQYIINIYYHASYYALFIDMLRTAPSVSCIFSTDDPASSRVQSDWSLVGGGN